MTLHVPVKQDIVRDVSVSPKRKKKDTTNISY
jgi:hypothetical protein